MHSQRSRQLRTWYFGRSTTVQHASVFPQGSELPWNPQALFCFQSTGTSVSWVPSLSLSSSTMCTHPLNTRAKADEEPASPLLLKWHGLRRVLLSGRSLNRGCRGLRPLPGFGVSPTSSFFSGRRRQAREGKHETGRIIKRNSRRISGDDL